MSYFLVYFEKKNSDSKNYARLSSVGKFSVPSEIFAGWVSVIYEGRKRTAALVSDWSRQAANDLFGKSGAGARQQFFDFINDRLQGGG
ncbi:hypothetical protein [Burkholderia lata]